MREICMSGLMSGEGKRSVAAWPKPPRPSSTLLKRGKNDAADAAAICEAMSRPEMRFVPVKSEEQQATLMLHKTRELLIKQRTMGINSLRGHLSEFGIVAAKGLGRVDELLEKAESDATLPEIAKAALTILVQHLEAIEASIAVLDQEIAAVHTQSPVSRLLASIPGIGKITASAIVASVPDPSIFKSGRDFSAWLGMTPRQNSSGGKEKLGSITKMGNRYLRKMLVVGCTSVLRVAAKYKGALAEWIVAMKARKPERHAAVALANKIARICWAIMSTGEHFREELYTRA